MLRNVPSRPALVCMFLALLELVRLQAIQVRQDHVFGEVLVRKHAHFEQVMTEQAAGSDVARVATRAVQIARGTDGVRDVRSDIVVDKDAG